jgi:thiol:disulfide interchange protein DsbD
MYGAAAWLAWVFALQTGTNALPFLFAAAIAVAFAAWAWGASQSAGKPWIPRIAALAALVAAIPLTSAGAAQTAPAATGASAAGSTTASLPIEPWSPERVAALRAEGRPVFVDFTAAWCVTCQVNERVALSTARVKGAFGRTHTAYLTADWTRRDPAIAQALAAQGRAGVPLYLLYAKNGGAPAILPQLLTEDTVVAALDKAAKG